MKLHWIFNRYMKPADDGTQGGGGGGAADRGDDFTPTGSDADKGTTTVELTEEDEELAEGLRGGKDAKDDEVDDTEDEDDEEEEKKAKAKAKDSRIPLKRHKEILQREREQRQALEEQLAKFQTGQQVADTNKEIDAAEKKLDELESQYEELLADGKTADARQLRQQIRTMEREVAEHRANLNAQATTARAIEQVRYDTTVERLEAQFPQINPDHEDFDREKVAEVMELKMAFQAKGETPSKALQKAVKYVFPVSTAAQREATEVKARVNEDDPKVAAAKKRVADAVKRNTDAAGKQPASTTKAGMDHDKAGGKLTAEAVVKMTQDAFAKLSDEDLAALRGDDI